MPPRNLFQDNEYIQGALDNADDAESSSAVVEAFRSTQTKFEDLRDVFVDSDFYARTSSLAESGKRHGAIAFGVLGSAAWIVATTALIVAIPLIYEIDRELGDPQAAEAAAAGLASSESPNGPSGVPGSQTS